MITRNILILFILSFSVSVLLQNINAEAAVLCPNSSVSSTQGILIETNGTCSRGKYIDSSFNGVRILKYGNIPDHDMLFHPIEVAGFENTLHARQK